MSLIIDKFCILKSTKDTCTILQMINLITLIRPHDVVLKVAIDLHRQTDVYHSTVRFK